MEDTSKEVIERVGKMVITEAEKDVEKAKYALEKMIESKPELVKAVEIVDEVLQGQTCGCSILGWKISAQKSDRSREKPLSTSLDQVSKESK